MKIAVCVGVDLELEERAPDLQPLDAALRIRETTGESEIVAVAIGRAEVRAGIQLALALGADRAVEALVEGGGLDVMAMAKVTAFVLGREEADLLIFGELSGGNAGASLAAAVAELLHRPVVSHLWGISIEDGHVGGTRLVEGGYERLRLPLPAVVSLARYGGEPLFPTMAGIAAAGSKPVERLSNEVFRAALAPSTVVLERRDAFAGRERRVIRDDGHGAEAILDFLIERELV